MIREERREAARKVGAESDKLIISLQKLAFSENGMALNKRKSFFLKGGAFALTYK